MPLSFLYFHHLVQCLARGKIRDFAELNCFDEGPKPSNANAASSERVIEESQWIEVQLANCKLEMFLKDKNRPPQIKPGGLPFEFSFNRTEC